MTWMVLLLIYTMIFNRLVMSYDLCVTAVKVF